MVKETKKVLKYVKYKNNYKSLKMYECISSHKALRSILTNILTVT